MMTVDNNLRHIDGGRERDSIALKVLNVHFKCNDEKKEFAFNSEKSCGPAVVVDEHHSLNHCERSVITRVVLLFLWIIVTSRVHAYWREMSSIVKYRWWMPSEVEQPRKNCFGYWP